MSRAKPLALVALLFVVTVELLRACGPLLDTVAGQVGTAVAAAVGLGLFVLPGALLVTLRRVSLPVVLLLLLLVRVTAQFVTELPLVGAAALLAMTALGLAVQRAADPVTAVGGVLLGGALDLAVRSITITWDPLWTGLPGLIMALPIVIALWLTLAMPAPDRETVLRGRIWALGGYLALWTTTIGNPAFVASQSGVGLQLCLAAMIVGLTLAVETVRRMRLLGGSGAIPEPDAWFAGLAAGVALVLLIALAWWGAGIAVVVAIPLATIAAAVVLARAIAAPGDPGGWAYGVIWVLPVLLFQVHYDLPLPFDNRYVLLAPAFLLALAAAGRRPWTAHALSAASGRSGAAGGSPVAGSPVAGSVGGGWITGPVASTGPPAVRRLVSGGTQVMVALLLVPLVVLVIPPSTSDLSDLSPSASSIRLMTWNVKYGRDDQSGAADPRQIAAAIRQARPDVVVLQEVSRGWAIGGGVDMGEYLSRSLGMAYRWAPAADGQFGNLLLTNRRLTNVHVGQLPFGQGPMQRSFLFATVMLTDSAGIDLVTTHLTHKKENTPTRLSQIDTALRERPMVLAGDLNFWPTWAEQASFVRAGYVSAQDVTGNGPQWTSPADKPTNRVDWIWGTDRVSFGGFEILSSVTGSDHLPLMVTVTLR